MTKYKYSNRSLKNIDGIDTRLIILLGIMLDKSPYDFIVTEGVRSKKRQKQLVAEGKSKTMNSKHIVKKAFDIAMLDENGNVTWNIDYYRKFAEIFLKTAKRLGYNCEWGGNWKSFVDAPHFQINN